MSDLMSRLNIFWLWSPTIIISVLCLSTCLLFYLLLKLHRLLCGLSDDINAIKNYFRLPLLPRTKRQRREYFFAFISKRIYDLIDQDKTIDEIKQYVIDRYGKRKFKQWKDYIYYVKKEHEINSEHEIPTSYRGRLMPRDDN